MGDRENETMIFKSEDIFRFQKPLLLFFGGVFLALLAVFVSAAYVLQNYYIDQSINKQLNNVQHLFQQELEFESQFISAILDHYETDTNLQQAFLDRNKDKLLSLTLPLFQSIKNNHNITHFYFITPDKTCFLRVHNPSRDGDVIGRFTMNQAFESGKISHGIELGPYGTFSLRVVKPWIIDGELAGYLEFSKEIHHITPRLKYSLGMELFFLVNKKHLSKVNWLEGLTMTGITGKWDEIPDHVIIDRTLSTIPADMKELVALSHIEKKGRKFTTSFDSRKFHGGFIVLRDASGKDVGEIIALTDVTREISASSASGAILAACIILGAFTFTLFYVFTNRLRAKLLSSYSSLKHEIRVRSETEQKLYQHEQNLEAVVLDRTSKLAIANTKLEKEIQERKSAELSLLARETILRKSQEIAHIGSWSVDLKTGDMLWSEEIYQIFGFPIAATKPDYKLFQKAIHLDDREKVKEAYDLALSEHKPYDIVFRILRPDGTERIVHEKSEEKYDETGKAIYSIGVTHDITEQVAAQKALHESDEQLRLLIQSSEDMISLHDLNGTYIYYNGPSRYLLKSEDIIGKTPFDFFDHNTADMLVNRIKETGHTGKSFTYEIQLDWFGEKIWFSEYIYPVYEQDGTLTKVAKIRRRIDKLKKAEFEIQASQKDLMLRKEAEEKIRLAYSELDQIFNAAVPLSVTKDFKLMKVNKAFCSYFGLTEGEVIGKKCFDFWDSQFCTTDICPMENIFAGQDTFQRDIDRIINGRHIICSIRAVPFKDENGNILGIVSTFFDMADRKRAEERLHKAQQQLLHAEKLSAVGQLSASIAHEFNNPLQGVMAVLSGVKKRVPLDENNANLLSLALSECNRMKLLIKDLQNFNRPTSGIIEPINIHSTIDSILLMSKKNLQVKKITIIKAYAAHMPLIKAVSDQIKQVVLNLLNNASDACRDGGTITIKTKVLDEKISLAIEDSGAGIRKEDIQHIFEPFFTTKPAVKGTGLGLSVSYGIIKKHGGSIEVKSETGKGTCFTVTLPIDGVNEMLT